MTSYSIDGINGGQPVRVAIDTTNQLVGDAYAAQIQAFIAVYNEAMQTTSYQVTDTDFQNLQQAYLALQSLAAGNASINGTAQSSLGNINIQMAQNLQLLTKTLEAATDGGSPPQSLLSYLSSGSSTSSPGALAALQNWLTLSSAGLGNILNGAVTAGTSWQSIQAMIELQYVQAANNQINSALGQLQSALTATDSAVSFLTQLQNLYNDVTPAPTASQSGGISTSSGSYGGQTAESFVQAYINNGNNTYNNPISVVANTSAASIQQFNNMYNTQLPQLITQVMTAAGYQQSDIAAVLANPGTAVPTTSGDSLDGAWSGSLAQQLVTIYNDMKTAVTNGGSNPLAYYIQDNQVPVNGTVSSSGGDFGRNLAAAEVAAQSLNTQQQQAVQQQLYIFQQFYQSASGVLTALTQIIQNMAQAAGQ